MLFLGKNSEKMMDSVRMLRVTGIFAIVFTVVMSSLTISLTVFASESGLPSQIINVVYDDSGSMIKTNGEPVDTWCQAKYSMEVFAAMLGVEDTMNIYVMSDYDGGKEADSPRLTLHGSDGVQTNVDKVHNMITNAANTPFDAVRKAYKDLDEADADKKWLVILTDGAFEDGAFTNKQVEEYLDGKSEDISVMFLSMGEDAAEIKENPDKGIFFEKAESNDQILNKITEICTRIFNSDRLSVDMTNQTVSFDIPMNEIVIFAQGAEVEIRSISDANGREISPDNKPVTVKYSEEATSNERYTDIKIDRGLVGSIASFSEIFEAGTYTVNVSGAETLEVYYKPDVEIMAWLVDDGDMEVPYTDGVKAGDYKLKLGLVKTGTSESINESPLLGDVDYHAVAKYNGVEDGKEYKQGDKIAIKEGKYEIDAEAKYLNYHRVSTEINFEVFSDKELFFTVLDSPEYQIDKEGFLNADEPIVISIELEDEEIDDAIWEKMSVPYLRQAAHADRRVDFKLEKTDELGIYHIYPFLVDEKTSIGDYGKIEYGLKQQYSDEKRLWSGEDKETVYIKDLRNWFWKHIDKVIKLSILAAILFFLAGYLPIFKKYLPKKLKKKPTINCEGKVGSRKTWTANGDYKKKRVSTFVPYVAEKGTIRFLPKGHAVVPAIRIRASGSNRFDIVNTAAYAGKNNITINGSAVPGGTKKPLKGTAGTRIKVETREADYTCVLNK